MLRDKNLIPLSRQHQHALALCVRISRAALATPVELKAWQSEIGKHFGQEIQYHFAAEETHLFPAARRHPQLAPLVNELLAEHSQLRRDFAQAATGALDGLGVRKFAATLRAHIRKEERQLFEGMQKVMTQEDLLQIGARINETLASASEACIVPAETLLNQPDS